MKKETKLLEVLIILEVRNEFQQSWIPKTEKPTLRLSIGVMLARSVT